MFKCIPLLKGETRKEEEGIKVRDCGGSGRTTHFSVHPPMIDDLVDDVVANEEGNDWRCKKIRRRRRSSRRRSIDGWGGSVNIDTNLSIVVMFVISNHLRKLQLFRLKPLPLPNILVRNFRLYIVFLSKEISKTTNKLTTCCCKHDKEIRNIYVSFETKSSPKNNS